jgi:hypothetical protein
MAPGCQFRGSPVVVAFVGTRLATLGALLVTLFLAPPFAEAANVSPECRSSSQTSAGDQYCERFPTADGEDDIGAAHRLETTLPRVVVNRLERSGRAGRILLALPAPPGVDDRAENGRAGVGDVRASEGSPPRARPGRTLEGVAISLKQLPLSGGFRWMMLFTTLGLFGIAWLGARRNF